MNSTIQEVIISLQSKYDLSQPNVIDFLSKEIVRSYFKIHHSIYIDEVYPHIKDYNAPTLSLPNKLLKIENAEIISNLLDELYLSSIPESTKKSNGFFLTENQAVVNLMLDSLNFDTEKILGKRILEPAVGFGYFILPIIHRITKKLQQYQYSGINMPKYLLRRHKSFCVYFS